MIRNNNNIIAPASKSILQRVMLLSLLSESKIKLKNVTWCNDTLTVKKILETLGSTVIINNNTVIIDSTNINTNKKNINVGESGLAVKIFSIYFAIFNNHVTLNGTGTLLNRNLSDIKTVLKKLEVKVTLTNNTLPLSIKGKIIPKNIQIDAANSSQILSGLLMVLPKLNSDIKIKVENIKSIPYIDLTIKMLSDFGIKIKNNNYKEFFIPKKQIYLAPKIYYIDGDWSGAAFFCVFGAISKPILIKNLDINSNQADKKIIDILQNVGATVAIKENEIKISPNKLNNFEFNAENYPDLFPPLVCLASFCNKTSKITGVKRLFNKESNRAKTLQQEFSKINISIKIIDNDMFITPKKINFYSVEIDSHNDHRIAMAMATVAAITKKNITIKNKDSIQKSYPFFYDDLSKISGINF